ncbi:hypothetical protein BY996DRAFT_744583 [Phakopsora pachyrhizi]|nr:hypothetical protein BY996DRAFT_744583 [Phakopsora pachyrhizi]
MRFEKTLLRPHAFIKQLSWVVIVVGGVVSEPDRSSVRHGPGRVRLWNHHSQHSADVNCATSHWRRTTPRVISRYFTLTGKIQRFSQTFFNVQVLQMVLNILHSFKKKWIKDTNTNFFNDKHSLYLI